MSKSKEPIEMKYAGTVPCDFCNNMLASYRTTKQLEQYCCKMCIYNAIIAGFEPRQLPEMPEALRILHNEK